MRVLINVTPTPEQLGIISRNRPGTEVIRGAAGSGKTTTALLRLRSLIGMFVSRKRRIQRDEPIHILVLTFNRTLRGYIRALAKQQVNENDEIDLEISTFARWAKTALNDPPIISNYERISRIETLGNNISLPSNFLVKEAEYVRGKFLPDNIGNYLTARRDGRGISPRVDRPLRESILEDVIYPYEEWKKDRGLIDWNDLAVQFTQNQLENLYDIIIVDEVQDFSANQIRAIRNQLAETHSLTLIVDTAQKIYAHGFTWHEVGITIRPENSRRLRRNYRNTVEIAQFAAPLVDNLPVDDDFTIPDFSSCEEHGPIPIVLKGLFSEQIDFVIDYIQENVDLEDESLAFLHPLGGKWFNYTKKTLDEAELDWVEITREAEWPEGDENIALSTLHSSKGLEFDHVVIIGLNDECLSHGDEEDDDSLITLRRLLAMAIGRACNSVILGYKPDDAPRLIDYLDPTTFREIDL